MNFLAHLYLSPATPEGWLGGLLGDFVKGPVDAALESAPHAVPERFSRMPPWMVSQDWLVSYRDPAGAMQALERVSRRLSDGSGLLAAAAEVHSRYGEMESDFRRFFPALLAAFPAAGRAPIA